MSRHGIGSIALRGFMAAICVTAACAVVAQAPTRPLQPGDFAWQWPLDVRDSDGVVRVTLTPEVYARLTRADLSDLAAFNGAGEPIPFGPAAQAFERLQPPPPATPVEVPLFRVPRATAASGERIELHIGRGSDGRLTQLDATIEPTATQAAHDVLLDVSAVDAPVTALQLELDTLPAYGMDARVEVAASDDLATWQTLASGLAVVSLREAGLALERTRLELPATALPYLRLRRIDREETLPLRAVRALPLRGTLALLPGHQSFVLQGRALPDAPGSFEYRSAGPFPIERIAIALADTNSVSGFVLESRAGDGTWIERARGTAFRLGNNGEGVMPAPIELPILRDSQWRLRTEPAQPRAPQLTLSWRPEQFVLLTQGAAPYRLAAGSRAARRPEYPLRSVLAEMRARQGDLWLPTEAAVGAGAPLAGEAALNEPPAPPPYKQWLLWGVLLSGAALVIGMVLKLMRAPPAAP